MQPSSTNGYLGVPGSSGDPYMWEIRHRHKARRQFRFVWSDVPINHPGATGPASRDRVSYLLHAARSRRDTIRRIQNSNGERGFQIGALQLLETKPTNGELKC